MLRNAVGGGCVRFPGKKRYEDVRTNVISITRGLVGVKFPRKKRYVTLEWPLSHDVLWCRHTGGVRLFSCASMVKQCLALINEGIQHHNFQLSDYAISALVHVLRYVGRFLSYADGANYIVILL